MDERDVLRDMMRLLYRIRFFEEALPGLYDYHAYYARSGPGSGARSTEELLTCTLYDFASDGLIGGAVHLYIGQEAVAVGVCSALEPDDYVTSTHRGHGHAIAKGADVRQVLAELMGRETGQCHGCGGSMHIFDMERGLLGGNGIVGAGMPLALGPAFAAKYRGTRQVSVAFFGDGASNQGTFHESLNLAALWRLPVLFVCENNQWAASTSARIAFPTEDIAPRATGYGIPGEIVDGQDVVAVYEVAGRAVERARAGGGPSLIEAKTYRFQGHCGVSRGHEDPEACERWRQRDPVALHEKRVQAEGIMDEAELAVLREEVRGEIREAIEYAKASPLPSPELVGLPGGPREAQDA